MCHLCEDGFHQLAQQLFSRNLGVEHVRYQSSSELKRPRRRAQATEEVCDCFSQSWLLYKKITTQTT